MSSSNYNKNGYKIYTTEPSIVNNASQEYHKTSNQDHVFSEFGSKQSPSPEFNGKNLDQLNNAKIDSKNFSNQLSNLDIP